MSKRLYYIKSSTQQYCIINQYFMKMPTVQQFVFEAQSCGLNSTIALIFDHASGFEYNRLNPIYLMGIIRMSVSKWGFKMRLQNIHITSTHFKQCLTSALTYTQLPSHLKNFLSLQRSLESQEPQDFAVWSHMEFQEIKQVYLDPNFPQ